MNLPAFFQAALEASWQGSLAMIIILALRPLLRAQIAAGWRSFLWTLALIRLLVPAFFLPSSPASIQNYAGGAQSVQRVRVVWATGETSEAEKSIAANPVTDPPRPNIGLDWWKLTAQVWLGGAFILGLWLFGGGLSLRRRLARERVEADESLAQIWRACCESAGLRRPPRLLPTDAVTSPALVGALHPLLLFPRRDQEKLSRKDCEHIFLHELAHFRRGDHWTHLLQLCALCIHWFNPLVWLGFRSLRADRELAADEWALQHLAPDRAASYGETLLRMLVAQTAPAFPRSTIGIMEDGAQIKQRLRRIVAFRPRRLAGSFAGLGLVVGMAALILTAAESTVGSLRGWSVVSVAIPKEGGIQDAYVELKSPAGRTVTLTSGITTQEGVTLEKLEWSGAPIHAVATLRKGDERAELSAAPGLISQHNELSRISAQVEIESKLIEIPDAVARELTVSGRSPFTDKRSGTPPPPGAAPPIILNEKDADALLVKLSSQQGIEVLGAPRVTTRSQQRAVVEIVHEIRYPTEYERNEGKMTPTVFEARNCGITLDIEPRLAEGGMIDLKLSPQVIEFLGFISIPSGETMPVKRDPGQSFKDRLAAPKLPDKPLAPDETCQPVFSARKVTSEFSISSGHTAVLFVAGATEEIKGLPPPSAGKQLLVLVRAIIMPPKETTPSPAPKATPPPAANPPPALSETPVALPVEGKPGYVLSPYSPQSGYIDVRGVASGKELQDPYTGKKFLVP